MKPSEYKEKLIAWNSTEKYKKELEFLCKLIDPKRGQKVLDYGCGTGYAMKHLHYAHDCEVFGYDVNRELYMWDEFRLRTELYFKVNTVFFNHSIAHIEYPPLTRLREEFMERDGRLVIITPNADWLDPGYNNDSTVVRHHTLASLRELVERAGFTVEYIGQFGEVRGNVNERIFLTAK